MQLMHEIGYYLIVILISRPSLIFVKSFNCSGYSASAQIFTLAASLISFNLLIGVFPKPIAMLFPSIQKAISPNFTISLALSSVFTLIFGISKYISSPHVFIDDFNGSSLIISLQFCFFEVCSLRLYLKLLS